LIERLHLRDGKAAWKDRLGEGIRMPSAYENLHYLGYSGEAVHFSKAGINVSASDTPA
jgi:hypothetical protein